MAERMAVAARHIEKRKWLFYFRQTLEQKAREGCFSLHLLFVKWPRR
jgi:hypothetical protein